MRTFSLSLLGLLSIVLPSCRTALVYVDVSSRVESALRGGEASCDVWENKEWHLTENELVEVEYANGARQYFIPVSMSPRRWLRGVVSYHASNYSIPRYSVSKSSDRVLRPKQLYVPLCTFTDVTIGGAERARPAIEHILPHPMSHATQKKVLAALGVQGAASPQAPMRSYEQSEFPASDMRVLRRIPIAQMQQKLAKRSDLNQMRIFITHVPPFLCA